MLVCQARLGTSKLPYGYKRRYGAGTAEAERAPKRSSSARSKTGMQLDTGEEEEPDTGEGNRAVEHEAGIRQMSS